MAELSPAAQAIAIAVDHYETNHWLTPCEVAAIALRAAAPKMEFVQDHQHLLAIAGELEGANNSREGGFDA